MARPSLLYIAADGPRDHKQEEKIKCDMARKVVELVDWPCELKTLYRDSNLGCKIAVSSAIDWFFSQEEEGIILEDDCVPDLSFLHFSSKMLERYRSDQRIMMICGTNYLYRKEKTFSIQLKESYFFSDYYPIWGWATWRRAWQKYDVKISTWPERRKNEELHWLFGVKRIANHYKGMFDLVHDKGFDTWDIQWWYACIFNKGLAIVPKHNLIHNIGTEGTHTSTQGQTFLNLQVSPIDNQNLIHPMDVFPTIVPNRKIYKTVGVMLTLPQLFVRKIKSLIYR